MSLKSVGKWLISVLLLLVILLPLLVFTQWGNRLLISGLNLLPFLKMDFEQGHILSDASFAEIELDFEVIIIRIEDLQYSLQARCLAKSQLCIKSLKTAGVFIEMPEINEEEAEEEEQVSAPELIVLPIDLLLNNVEVAEFKFTQSAIEIKARDLSTDIEAKKSRFLISEAKLQRLEVALTDTAQAEQPVKASPADAPQPDWPLAQLPDVFIPLALDVNALQLRAFDLKLATDPQQIPVIKTKDITLLARWSGYQLDIETLDITSPDYGVAALSGHMDWQYPWGTEFLLNTQVRHFPWYQPLENSKQQIKASGDFSQLSLQLISEGPFKLAADVQTNLVDSKLPFVADLQSPSVDLQELVGEPLLLEKVATNVSGNLQQQEFNAQLVMKGFGYQQGSLSLSGTHNNQVVNVGTFRFQDTPTDSLINGQLNLDYGSEFALKLDAKVPALTLPDITVGRVPIAGRINGQIHILGQLDMEQLPQSLEQPGKWQLSSYNTELEGIINEQPAGLKANFSVNQDLAVQDATIQAQFQDSSLNLSGYSDDRWHVTGAWQGAEFQRWHPHLKGRISSDIKISGELMDPNIVLDATLNGLQYETVNVPQADIDISYWPVQNHKAEVSIASSNAQLQAYKLENISASVTGDLNAQTIAVDAEGDLPVHLLVDNQLDLQKLVSQLEVREAHLGYLQYLWTLQKGFSSTIDIEGQQASLSAHCWQQSDNELCVTESGQLANDGNIALRWQLQLGDYDQLFLGEAIELDSLIKGDIKVAWQQLALSQLDLKNTIESGSLTLVGEEKKSTLLNWSEGQISANSNQSLANFDVFLNRQDGSQLIAGDAQITLDQEELPIQGNLDIERFQIQVIEELVPGMSKARGDFSAAIDFSGVVSNPVLSGSMSLHDGELATFQSPNSIDSINLDMDFRGQSAEVDGGFMIREHPGEITANLDWSDGLDAKARLFAEKLPILFPPNLNAMVGTDIHLDFSDQVAQVGGEIKVLDGLFQLEDLPEGSIKVSDDAIIVDASGKEVEKDNTLAITSDVDLSIDPKFRLKGQGFTGNLGGKLKIRQEKFQPVQLFGVLKIANGKYKAYGQNLDVQSGEISFVGSPSNPTINVKAVREIKDENVTAGLSIIGPTDALSLTFFSNPSMPQPEILSYITRGRGLDSSSGGGAAVGVALASALTKTTPIQNVVQKLPLLSDVSLDAEVEGDTTQATISGYLGERIFLKYGIGVYEPINELTVRLYLMSRLWLETVSGLENSADIFYSFEID